MLSLLSSLLLAAGGTAVAIVPHDPRTLRELRIERCAPNPDMAIVVHGCTAVLALPTLPNAVRALAYAYRAQAYWHQHHLDAAIADYSMAIHLEPRNTSSLVNRGIVRRARGQIDLAIADYNRAISIDPHNPYAYSNRATARIDKRDLHGAIADYTVAIEFDPSNARVYVNRGITYDKAGNFDLALIDYDAAIRIDPNQAEAFAGRCYVLAEQRKYAQALPNCDKAIDAKPDAQNWDSLGLVHLQIHLYQIAIGDYDNALAMSADMASALYGRGVAKIRLMDASGWSDIAAARAADKAIETKMAHLGVYP